MTVVTCGRTNLSDRAEAITRVLREQQGFALDVGCGQTFDLDNPLSHMRISRCFECWRWLCVPCITAHFEETTDAYRAPGRARGPAATGHGQPSSSGGVDAETRIAMAGAGAADVTTMEHLSMQGVPVVGADFDRTPPTAPSSAATTNGQNEKAPSRL